MPRPAALLVLLASLLFIAPASAAQRCDFKGSRTVASNSQARIFWVKGKRGDKRVYFGCRKKQRPILLATDRTPRAEDEIRTANSTFRLAGTWVAFRQVNSSGDGEYAQLVVVRSLAGSRRQVQQDLGRSLLKRLVLTPDGAVAWVLADGLFREVDGVAPGAARAVALAVAQGIDSDSLTLAKGAAHFTVGGAPRSVRLTAPAASVTGNGVGTQGLDGRFGDCGTLVPSSPKPGVFTEATQLARAPSGALVSAGTTSSSSANADSAVRDTFVVARFSAAGKFDGGFGRTGVVQVKVPRPSGAGDATLSALAVQPDGKVLVGGSVELSEAGTFRAVVMRFTAGGTLDDSFGNGGIVQGAIPAAKSARVEDLALTADGHILVAGQRDNRYFVARLDGAGALDESFSTDGLVTDPGKQPSELRALVVADDGSIFAAGGTGLPLLLHLDATGAILSVSSDGPPATAMLRALEAAPGGGVIAVGAGSNITGAGQAVLARYGTDGKPSGGFGTGGFVLDPDITEPNDIAVAPDGSLLISARFSLDPGGYSGSGLVRYSAVGARDTGFGFRGALGGTSSFGLENFDIVTGDDGTAHVAQDNGTAFAISRFAVDAPALGATSGRSSVCAMATATQLGPLVKAGRIDVSLRLRAPGRVRLDAVVKVGGTRIPAGTVTVFRPYTEGAVASIPLTKKALAALRTAKTATLTLGAGAPGGKQTAYTATLTR
ncbi:MAG: delta-60 repeat domain-containing protein [Solirubrobacteraceae bacterium]